MLTESFLRERKEFLRSKKIHSPSYRDLRHMGFGRPQKVSSEELRKLKRVLKTGAKSVGHSTDKWSLSRIQDLIQKEYLAKNETINRTQVMRLMQEMGFHCESPV